MSQFKKLYMYPNLDNQETTPASGLTMESPEICIAGDSPILDYKTSLITPDPYTNKPLIIDKDNYIYVRGKNGSKSSNAICKVTLYYIEKIQVQIPSLWQYNKIRTDLGEEEGRIINVRPNEIGVVDRPFVWRNAPDFLVQNFVLAAQFNDDHNSNPFPSVSSIFTFSDMTPHVLQWGYSFPEKRQNNIETKFSYQTILDVPVDIDEPERKYFLHLEPSDSFIGYYVSFICSQPDSMGKKIELEPTLVISKGKIFTCSCTLKPGFTGLISVYAYLKDSQPMPIHGDLRFTATYEKRNKIKVEKALHIYNCKQNISSVNQ